MPTSPSPSGLEPSCCQHRPQQGSPELGVGSLPWVCVGKPPGAQGTGTWPLCLTVKRGKDPEWQPRSLRAGVHGPHAGSAVDASKVLSEVPHLSNADTNSPSCFSWAMHGWYLAHASEERLSWVPGSMLRDHGQQQEASGNASAYGGGCSRLESVQSRLGVVAGSCPVQRPGPVMAGDAGSPSLPPHLRVMLGLHHISSVLRWLNDIPVASRRPHQDSSGPSMLCSTRSPEPMLNCGALATCSGGFAWTKTHLKVQSGDAP